MQLVPQGEREIKALENHGAYERVLEGGELLGVDGFIGGARPLHERVRKRIDDLPYTCIGAQEAYGGRVSGWNGWDDF